MIQALLAEAWPYMATVAGIIAGFFFARQSGKAAGKKEVEQQAIKRRLENINEARNVENKTSALDDDSVIRRLKSSWVRDRKR